MRNTVALAVCCLLTGGLLVLNPGSTAAHPYGEEQIVPLDFITGGFWFIIQAPSSGHPPVGSIPGTRANGGWHGGVKNHDWWGNGNYRDHGIDLHVNVLTVTGYLRIGTDGTDAKGRKTGTRDICGTARTNLYGTVKFRVRMKDLGEPGRTDKFGIALYPPGGGVVYFAWGSLGDPTPGGGNLQLHRGNDSNTAPSTAPDCPPDVFTGHAFT